MWNYLQGQKRRKLIWGEIWLPPQNARTRVRLLYVFLKNVEDNNHLHFCLSGVYFVGPFVLVACPDFCCTILPIYPNNKIHFMPGK